MQQNGFHFLPAAYDDALDQVPTEPDGESLPKFVPSGFDEHDVDATIVVSFLILHLEGCIY